MSNIFLENELNTLDKNLVGENINTTSFKNVKNTENFDISSNTSPSLDELNITPNIDNDINKEEECTSLVVVKDNKLFVAQKMFKKSIKLSIKSFLISLSLGFLNLFI